MLDASYAYLNWWLDGRPGAIMAKSGAYMANPATVKRVLRPEEWSFWYEGGVASIDILDAEGAVIFRRGERREGGGTLRTRAVGERRRSLLSFRQPNKDCRWRLLARVPTNKR